MLIDYAFGLSQLSGNEALLIKLFGKISSEYRDTPQKLTEMFERGQWEDAKILVHTLKGVSGNLGCTALHKITKEIDAELKESQSVPIPIEELYSVLNDTIAKIDEIESLGEIPKASAQGSNQDAKKELIDMLESNAFISPSDASRLLKEIALGPTQKQELETCITTLDYKRALEILQA